MQCYVCYESGRTEFDFDRWKPKRGRVRGQDTSKYKHMKYNNTEDSVSNGSRGDNEGVERRNSDNQRENNYSSKRGRLGSNSGRE